MTTHHHPHPTFAWPTEPQVEPQVQPQPLTPQYVVPMPTFELGPIVPQPPSMQAPVAQQQPLAPMPDPQYGAIAQQPFLAQHASVMTPSQIQQYAFRDDLHAGVMPAPQAHVPAAPAGYIAQPPRQPSTVVVQHKNRLRWENIFPFAAGGMMILAAILFVTQLDEIQGKKGAARDAAAAQARQQTLNSSEQPAQPATTAPGQLTDQQITAKLNRVSSMIAAGRYEDAGLILQPLGEYSKRNGRIAKLQAQLDASEARNITLTARLNRLFPAHQWKNVLATIAQIKQLHPLTSKQRSMERQARAALAASGHTSPGGQGGGGSTQPGNGGSGGAPQGNGNQSAPPRTSPGKVTPPKAPNVPNPQSGDGVGNPAMGN